MILILIEKTQSVVWKGTRGNTSAIDWWWSKTHPYWKDSMSGLKRNKRHTSAIDQTDSEMMILILIKKTQTLVWKGAMSNRLIVKWYYWRASIWTHKVQFSVVEICQSLRLYTVKLPQKDFAKFRQMILWEPLGRDQFCSNISPWFVRPGGEWTQDCETVSVLIL